MNANLLLLAADLLDLAADEFGKHGCNDLDLPAGFTDRDLEALALLMNRANFGDAPGGRAAIGRPPDGDRSPARDVGLDRHAGARLRAARDGAGWATNVNGCSEDCVACARGPAHNPHEVRLQATWHLRQGARFYSAARDMTDTAAYGSTELGKLLRAWDAMERCVWHLEQRAALLRGTH